MTEIPEACFDEKGHTGSRLICEERGRRVVFRKPRGSAADKIRIDGCVVHEKPACDYLVRDWRNRHHFVELKGKHDEEALEQIEATISLFIERGSKKRFWCFIVGSGSSPPACPVSSRERRASRSPGKGLKSSFVQICSNTASRLEFSGIRPGKTSVTTLRSARARAAVTSGPGVRRRSLPAIRRSGGFLHDRNGMNIFQKKFEQISGCGVVLIVPGGTAGASPIRARVRFISFFRRTSLTPPPRAGRRTRMRPWPLALHWRQRAPPARN
jgi:hypothetical protein